MFSFQFSVSSLSILIYSYNENLAQIMCHDVEKQVPLVYWYMCDDFFVFSNPFQSNYLQYKPKFYSITLGTYKELHNLFKNLYDYFVISNYAT